jgi:hypothetical protein
MICSAKPACANFDHALPLNNQLLVFLLQAAARRLTSRFCGEQCGPMPLSILTLLISIFTLHVDFHLALCYLTLY